VAQPPESMWTRHRVGPYAGISHWVYGRPLRGLLVSVVSLAILTGLLCLLALALMKPPALSGPAPSTEVVRYTVVSGPNIGRSWQEIRRTGETNLWPVGVAIAVWIALTWDLLLLSFGFRHNRYVESWKRNRLPTPHPLCDKFRRPAHLR